MSSLAKVPYSHFFVFSQEDVIKFDVSVDEAEMVHFLKHPCHLDKNLTGFDFINSFVLLAVLVGLKSPKFTKFLHHDDVL